MTIASIRRHAIELHHIEPRALSDVARAFAAKMAKEWGVSEQAIDARARILPGGVAQIVAEMEQDKAA